MAQAAAAAKVADADHNFGPEPAGAALAERGDWRALRTQPRQPLMQCLAIVALQREEGAAGEAEPPVIIAGEQRDRPQWKFGLWASAHRRQSAKLPSVVRLDPFPAA